jgi:DNA-3-methyladenine glycosylase I
MIARCHWVTDDPLYLDYHDREWGVPEHDGRALFEKLILDGFQAGLSWITILRKREAFRAAFAGFDPAKMARFGARDVTRLLADAGIVRHRGKIEGAIANAQAYLALGGAEPFARLAWSAVGGAPKRNHFRGNGDIPAATDESRALSKELRRLGFTFVGPTIVYAWMQACGLVNDHLVTCFRYSELAALKKRAR